MILKAPWNAAQVAALKRRQKDYFAHPYTCPEQHENRNLTATPNGWVCPTCGYTQNWCHMHDTFGFLNLNPWDVKQ